MIIFSCSRWFVTHRKKIEEVEFLDEEFQNKKVNNKYLNVDYGAFQKIHAVNGSLNCLESGIVEI